MNSSSAAKLMEGTSIPSAKYVIQIEDVHKYYELGETRVHALRGVSVEIARGEFVAIMGASGSGKSTFMNILGCLDKPSSGHYLLEGTDVSRHDKKALALIRNQKIGFVFQGFNLLADEPTGNLDSRTSVEIMEIFQNLNDKGLTIVLVTHEHDIAQFAKRVLIFRDGKIRKDDAVVNRPNASEVLKTLPTLED